MVMKYMHILKSLLSVSCLIEISFASLKNCSVPHDQPAICFKNGAGYSKPYPTLLDVKVFFKDIIEIDEEKNSIRIQMNLWTIWNDPKLKLSNGETEG